MAKNDPVCPSGVFMHDANGEIWGVKDGENIRPILFSEMEYKHEVHDNKVIQRMVPTVELTNGRTGETWNPNE